jgi:hypothetical protein
MEHLIVIAVLFLLSLLAAYVLFKWLDSAAIIKRQGYQAGGAFAGFLLIFGSLTVAHFKLVGLGSEHLRLKSEDLSQEVLVLSEQVEALRRAAKEQASRSGSEYWTVRGMVVRQDKEPQLNQGVSIGVIPHRSTESDSTGKFCLRYLKIGREEQYLRELQFGSEGYYLTSQILSRETAVFDEKAKTITLKDSIELWPMESDGNRIDLASNGSEMPETDLEGV